MITHSGKKHVICEYALIITYNYVHLCILYLIHLIVACMRGTASPINIYIINVGVKEFKISIISCNWWVIICFLFKKSQFNWIGLLASMLPTTETKSRCRHGWNNNNEKEKREKLHNIVMQTVISGQYHALRHFRLSSPANASAILSPRTLRWGESRTHNIYSICVSACLATVCFCFANCCACSPRCTIHCKLQDMYIYIRCGWGLICFILVPIKGGV